MHPYLKKICCAVAAALLCGQIAAANPGLTGPVKLPYAIERCRFGVGYGNAFYYTNQMDYILTVNMGEFKEIRPSFFLAGYYMFNQRWEGGFNYTHGSMLTLKSKNTQGSKCDFDHFQLNFQYSLNRNAGMRQSRFTANLQGGIGLIYFRSMYFTVDTAKKSIRSVYSTVGYGASSIGDRPVTIGFIDIPDKILAAVGNIGIHLGFRLTPNISLYLENTLNVTSSNRLSGNLFKKSWIPPDSYFYTGLGVYFNINSGSSAPLNCPK